MLTRTVCKFPFGNAPTLELIWKLLKESEFYYPSSNCVQIPTTRIVIFTLLLKFLPQCTKVVLLSRLSVSAAHADHVVVAACIHEVWIKSSCWLTAVEVLQWIWNKSQLSDSLCDSLCYLLCTATLLRVYMYHTWSACTAHTLGLLSKKSLV